MSNLARLDGKLAIVTGGGSGVAATAVVAAIAGRASADWCRRPRIPHPMSLHVAPATGARLDCVIVGVSDGAGAEVLDSDSDSDSDPDTGSFSDLNLSRR